MAVNLIRKNSDTPNIRNYDDARLFRYIIQNRSGIIKDYGDEVAMSKSGSNILHITSGEIIHQGWQVEISSGGFDITLDNRDSEEYYSVYLEINLSIASQQKAEIKFLKGNADYPVVNPGDDLTETPTGTSRLLIAQVYLVPSSSTFTITRKIDVITYYPSYAVESSHTTEADYASSDHSKGTIEQRLTDLGFKSGSCGISYNIVSTSGREGTPSLNSLLKQGQMVDMQLVIHNCSLGSKKIDNVWQYDTITLTIPQEYRPKGWFTISVCIGAYIHYSGYAEDISVEESIHYSGEIGPVSLETKAVVGPDGVITIDKNTSERTAAEYVAFRKPPVDADDSTGCRWVHIYAGWGLTQKTLDSVYQTDNDSSPTRMRMIIRIGATKQSEISRVDFMYKLTESDANWSYVSETTIYTRVIGVFDTQYEDTYYAVHIFDFSQIKPKMGKPRIIYSDGTSMEGNLVVFPWRVS